jgi:hypothetical protein
VFEEIERKRREKFGIRNCVRILGGCLKRKHLFGCGQDNKRERERVELRERMISVVLI